jgi:K+-transporting ATPase ATPase C chain
MAHPPIACRGPTLQGRPDTAEGPHITPEGAFSQVKRVSDATGITENPIKTLIRLNIERNRSENLGAFAPDYVNVLTLNLDLIDQYPEACGQFLELHNGGQLQMLV